ncbi:hypothetical protein TNCV_4660861, partial [Trichonephila clavipes]
MENQLVLLKDPNTKPLDWPMGRILEVFPPVVMVLFLKHSTKVTPRVIGEDPVSIQKDLKGQHITVNKKHCFTSTLKSWKITLKPVKNKIEDSIKQLGICGGRSYQTEFV